MRSTLVLPALLSALLLLLAPVAAQSVNARNLLKLSRSYANQNDWAQAKDYAEKALKEEPGYLDALYMRAFAHRELEEYGKAEADFNEVIRQDPNYLPTYGALADMFIKQKEYKKADEVFNRLSKAPSGAKWASYYRGVVAYLQADLEKAEKQWREVVNQDANFAPAYHNLGALYLAQNQTGKALSNFRAAAEKKPELAMYRFHVAWALERSGQVPEAQKTLRKIINEDGDDEKFHLLAMGLDRLTRNQSESALEVLSTVSKKSPQNLDVWILLGRANLALNRPEEARKALQQAKELDKSFQEIDQLLEKLPAAAKEEVEESTPKSDEATPESSQVKPES